MFCLDVLQLHLLLCIHCLYFIAIFFNCEFINKAERAVIFWFVSTPHLCDILEVHLVANEVKKIVK